MKIKLNEKNPHIFEKLQEIVPDCKIFQIADGSQFDTLYIFKYGERYIDDNLNDENTANIIRMMFIDNWDTSYDFFTTIDSAVKDGGRISTTEKTLKEEYTDTDESQEGVPAFNENEIAIDRQNSRTFNRKNSHSDNSINKYVSTDTVSNSFNYLTLNLLNDIIFKDVNRLITYTIF